MAEPRSQITVYGFQYVAMLGQHLFDEPAVNGAAVLRDQEARHDTCGPRLNRGPKFAPRSPGCTSVVTSDLDFVFDEEGEVIFRIGDVFAGVQNAGQLSCCCYRSCEVVRGAWHVERGTWS